MPPLKKFTPQAVKTPDNKTKKTLPYRWIFVAIAIVIALLLVVLNSYLQTKSSQNERTFSPKEFSFLIDFPEGKPATDKSIVFVDSVEVPQVKYTAEPEDGTAAYIVQVTTYPKTNFNLRGQERTALKSANNSLTSLENAKLISSSNDGIFLKYPSSENVFAADEEGVSYTYRTRSFIVGNTVYTIMTTQADEATFMTFANSFRFK